MHGIACTTLSCTNRIATSTQAILPSTFIRLFHYKGQGRMLAYTNKVPDAAIAAHTATALAHDLAPFNVTLQRHQSLQVLAM